MEEQQTTPVPEINDTSPKNKTTWIIVAVIALAVIALVVFLVSSGLGNRSADQDRALATVNGQAITARDIGTIELQLRQQYQMQGADLDSEPQLLNDIRQNALLNKIQQTVLLQHAEQQGLSADSDEIELEYQRSVAQFPGGEEELEAGLREMQLTKDGFRQEIAQMIILQKLASQYTEDISDSAVRTEYDDLVSQQEPGTDIPPFAEVEVNLRASMEQQQQINALQDLLNDLYLETEIEILSDDFKDLIEILGTGL